MAKHDQSPGAEWIRIAEAFASKDSSSAEDVIKLVAGLQNTLGAPAPTTEPAPTPKPVAQTSPRAETIHAAATDTTPAPAPAKTAEKPAPAPTSAAVETTPPASALTETPKEEPRLPEPTNQQPAVPIEESITDELVYCLECGRSMKMLKRHLKAAHGLTPEAYRHKWGLPEDYPVTAPNYSESKSAYAKDMQFGVTGAKAAPKRRGRRTKTE